MSQKRDDTVRLFERGVSVFYDPVRAQPTDATLKGFLYRPWRRRALHRVRFCKIILLPGLTLPDLVGKFTGQARSSSNWGRRVQRCLPSRYRSLWQRSFYEMR
jgi:hypothetical protein